MQMLFTTLKTHILGAEYVLAATICCLLLVVVRRSLPAHRVVCAAEVAEVNDL